MKLRYPALLVIILALGIVNVWKWVVRDEVVSFEQATGSSISKFLVSDFEIKGLTPPSGGNSSISRDLFYSLADKSREGIKENLTSSGEQKDILLDMSAKEVALTPIDPQITADLLEAEAARDDLAKLKYVGVLFHGERGEASLLFADQHYIVSAGDKLGSRFVVDKITTDAVDVSDPITKVSGQIRISGDSEMHLTK